MTTTLSGTASNWGVHARNGAILAVEQVNETGGIAGRQLELIIKASMAEVNDVIQEVKELDATMAVALALLAERYEYPQILKLTQEAIRLVEEQKG